MSYRVKVITMYVRKLSGLRCINYHVIRTKITGDIFLQLYFPGLKVINVLHPSYQIYGALITMLFIQK